MTCATFKFYPMFQDDEFYNPLLLELVLFVARSVYGENTLALYILLTQKSTRVCEYGQSPYA